MRHRRLAHWVVLVATVVGACQAGEPPRRFASWKEKEAKVVVFSPDGRSLVSSGDEGHRLRDAATGEVRAVLNTPPMKLVTKVEFSPDGRLLFAQAASDRERPLIVHDLKVWDVATGELRDVFPYVAEHLDEGSFALSGDGRWLAFVDNSERLPAQVKTGRIVIDGRHNLDISSNGHRALPRVKIWDVSRRKEVAVVDGGLPLAFSPDGEVLATGDRDWRTPVAKLWFTKVGRLPAELQDRSPGLWPLVFSPDGRFLASGEHVEKSLWDVRDGRRWPIETSSSSQRPAFSPDGKLYFPNGIPSMDPHLGGPKESFCFDLSAMPPSRINLGVGEMVVSHDGHRYAAIQGESGGPDPRTVILRDLPSGRETGRLDVTGLMGARFSPDGRWLALLTARQVAAHSIWQVRLVDPATARVHVEIPSTGPNWGNYGWTFSPDGMTLAVFYRTGSNSYRPGDPEPSDRPMNAEVWAIPPR
ncbi:WD40 repeat domain-containing protein [Planctomyces sp. SH-PL62]|uniref:WD40 repeat domain-containing protein n=1 Tax=Planctomyces sp. SH-PL62 TaxID=1636152 RepID=UPI00078C3F50|nr:WD40 repeat domain-containing protein [Planctomyces sp. SH-PL62]AMV41001.1 WD40-like Beta Propeller Repeat protein [Planctomyces sp. SH-PL62]